MQILLQPIDKRGVVYNRAYHFQRGCDVHPVPIHTVHTGVCDTRRTTSETTRGTTAQKETKDMLDTSKVTGTPFNIFPDYFNHDVSVPAFCMGYTKLAPADVPPGFTLWYLHENEDTGMLSTITVPDDSEGLVSSVLVPADIPLSPDENGVLFNLEPANILDDIIYLTEVILPPKDPEEREEIDNCVAALRATYERLYGDRYGYSLSEEMADASWSLLELTVSEWIDNIRYYNQPYASFLKE